jgi:hypothetical protein
MVCKARPSPLGACQPGLTDGGRLTVQLYGRTRTTDGAQPYEGDLTLDKSRVVEAKPPTAEIIASIGNQPEDLERLL